MAGLTGRDPNVNLSIMFCGTFTEDKKLVSNLHIMVTVTRYFCLQLGKNLDFCSAFEIRLLVESSYIKTNGLFQYQTRTTEWFNFFSTMY